MPPRPARQLPVRSSHLVDVRGRRQPLRHCLPETRATRLGATGKGGTTRVQTGERAGAEPEQTSARPASDRVLTVPNALSVLRLLGVPLFLWLVLSRARRLGRRWCSWSAASPTSWTARSPAAWNQMSQARAAARPGGRPALHPRHADRAHGPRRRAAVARPWLLVGRDVRAGRLPARAAPPRLRPAAGALPRQGGDLQPARTPSRCCCSATGDERASAEVAHAFGWAFAIWGTALYWWAGVLYVVQVRQLVAAPSADRAGGRGRRRPA